MNRKVMVCVVDPKDKERVAVAKPLEDAKMQVDYHFLHHTQDEEAVISTVKGYDYVVAGSEIWSRNVFAQTADHLKMLVRHGIGMDNVDIPAAIEMEIGISNTPGANASAVAEQILALILCGARNIVEYTNQMKSGIWSGRVTSSLEGVVGIVGFGAIGRAFARLLQPFPVEIIVYDNNQDEKAAAEVNVRFVTLDELIRISDFISLSIPCTEETRGLIDKVMLDKMKQTAYLVNTSRGGVINQADLTEVLRRKRIAGAALDVFIEEPLPAGDPLTKLDNVLLTPHCSSGSHSGLMSIYRHCVQNILNFETGKPFGGLFNPESLKRINP